MKQNVKRHSRRKKIEAKEDKDKYTESEKGWGQWNEGQKGRRATMRKQNGEGLEITGTKVIEVFPCERNQSITLSLAKEY